MAYRYDYVCDPEGDFSRKITALHPSGMHRHRYGVAMHNWVVELFGMGLGFWDIEEWTGLSAHYLEQIGRWHGIPLRW